MNQNRDELHSRLDGLAKQREVKRKEAADDHQNEPKPVSAGPVDKIVDVLVNPTEEKILEFTDFDRNQVTLIPQLGIINDIWQYCIEIAAYNESPDIYKEQYKKSSPALDNPVRRYIFLLAQCRRSLGGKTQKALEDLALADLQNRANEEDIVGGGYRDE